MNTSIEFKLQNFRFFLFIFGPAGAPGSGSSIKKTRINIHQRRHSATYHMYTHQIKETHCPSPSVIYATETTIGGKKQRETEKLKLNKKRVWVQEGEEKV